MKPPPPIFPADGYETAKANSVAIIASKALPPFSSLSTPLYDGEHGDDEGEVRREDRDAADGQGEDLNARPGEEPADEQLPGELGEPVEVVEVVDDTDGEHDESADDDREDVLLLAQHGRRREERQTL